MESELSCMVQICHVPLNRLDSRTAVGWCLIDYLGPSASRILNAWETYGHVSNYD